jgi:hypothetical protein
MAACTGRASRHDASRLRSAPFFPCPQSAVVHAPRGARLDRMVSFSFVPPPASGMPEWPRACQWPSTAGPPGRGAFPHTRTNAPGQPVTPSPPPLPPPSPAGPLPSPFAHPGERARRRDLGAYRYRSEMCKSMRRTGECALGDLCQQSHNVFEVRARPRGDCVRPPAQRLSSFPVLPLSRAATRPYQGGRRAMPAARPGVPPPPIPPRRPPPPPPPPPPPRPSPHAPSPPPYSPCPRAPFASTAPVLATPRALPHAILQGRPPV